MELWLNCARTVSTASASTLGAMDKTHKQTLILYLLLFVWWRPTAACCIGRVDLHSIAGGSRLPLLA